VAIYQPSAIVGNSRLLASIGARGELMALFYPRIDFPQNLREGMPAVYFLGEPPGGYLSWTFDPSWRAEQRYLERTNVLVTELQHEPTGLGLRITDLVHPYLPALVRRFEAVNHGGQVLRGKLFQYLAFQLGEVAHKNAVHFHAELSAGVVYWQDITFALGSEGMDDFSCGRATGGANSTKRQMEGGHLWRLEEEIGAVDFAAGWNLSLEPGETAARTLVVAADNNENGALELLDRLRQEGWERILETACNRWREHAARAEAPALAPDLTEAYYRCLLALELMIDPDHGSLIAAPEFDPEYQRSGGYGYCWPRDAVEVCLALEAAGDPGYMLRFLEWATRCQGPEGYWEQRFWLTGDRAPSWCTREGRLQIDQTAAVLFAMGQEARRLSGQERAAFLERTWESASLAAQDLNRSASTPTALHAPAFDLWETFRGTFTYSNAAISCALREAAFLARTVGEERLAESWEERAEVVRGAVFSRLWRGDIFVRGIDVEGRLETAADASILGLITPFPFLRLEEAEERRMATTMVDALVRRAGCTAGGAEMLLRYEGDQYAGGGPGAVSTLWLARALLCLALTEPENEEARAVCQARAEASMRAVLACGTPTGLLPEMTGPGKGELWAVPHAWSMASFVHTAVLLHRLQESRIKIAQEARPESG